MSLLDRPKDTLKNANRRVDPVDPARFDDPVALNTDWSPAKGGGTNICSHSLQKRNSFRLEFRARNLALLFPGLFMAVGVIAGFIMTSQGLAGDSTLLFLGPLFGTIFFTVGFLIYRSWSQPRVFDKKLGFYWQGKNCTRRNQVRESKEHCPLSEIHALQILQEYCRSSSSNGGGHSYYSYELNLVMKNGQRINVVDHGKLSQLRADSQTLARFLGVPIWDASSF